MTQFYNTILNFIVNHAISGKNYGHILNIWKAIKMNIMEDYNELHLKIDVSVPAFWKTFWKKSIHSFELDLTHYLSSLCYSWNIVLRFTDVNLIN